MPYEVLDIYVNWHDELDAYLTTLAGYPTRDAPAEELEFSGHMTPRETNRHKAKLTAIRHAKEEAVARVKNGQAMTADIFLDGNEYLFVAPTGRVHAGVTNPRHRVNRRNPR